MCCQLERSSRFEEIHKKLILRFLLIISAGVEFDLPVRYEQCRHVWTMWRISSHTRRHFVMFAYLMAKHQWTHLLIIRLCTPPSLLAHFPCILQVKDFHQTEKLFIFTTPPSSSSSSQSGEMKVTMISCQKKSANHFKTTIRWQITNGRESL